MCDQLSLNSVLPTKDDEGGRKLKRTYIMGGGNINAYESLPREGGLQKSAYLRVLTFWMTP